MQIMPLMRFTRSNRARLSLSIRVYKFNRYQIRVLDGIGRSDAQGVFENGLDGSPDVDDLITTFEERGCLGWKVVSYALWTSGVGLVDVNSLDGTAETDWFSGICGFAVVDGLVSADGVVEDEDFGGSGAVVVRLRFPFWKEIRTYAFFNSSSVSG